MKDLIEKRSETIQKLSFAIARVGELYRETEALAGQITKALGPEKAKRIPLPICADAFKRQMMEALNAAMAGKYGEPNKARILATGPLGEIQNTELLTVQAAEDHKNLATLAGVPNV